MLFMGMLMLVVLPLFLYVSGKTIGQNSSSGGAHFIRAILYFFALLSVLGSVIIIAELFK